MSKETMNRPIEQFLTWNSLSNAALSWGPRLICATFAGYYSLGIAYQTGIMAAVDRIAISILYRSAGYAGLGVMMPAVQWYSAWGVRVTFGICGGIVYDIAERVAFKSLALFYSLRAGKPNNNPNDIA